MALVRDDVNQRSILDIKNATVEKLMKFKSLCGRQVDSGTFWDVVVVTAMDERQKYSYEDQIKKKVDRKVLPLGIPYKVFSDPPGCKIGNGGSTLHALKNLRDIYGKALCKMKVLMIHAGGLSQRLPSASAFGKIFTTLPLGDPLYQMLELKLAIYVDFPSHMKPGVLVTCADDIELYSIANDERLVFDKPGFTALAHPSPLYVGTTHGVFVLEPPEDSAFRKMETKICLRFLHKPSIEKMRESDAVCKKKSDCFPICDPEFVYTDSTYYMDFDTSQCLLNVLKELGPLECEIDAYSDFLQALGQQATMEHTCNTANVTKHDSSLVDVRQKIFHLLRGTPLNVIVLNNSKFYHIGTTSEYLSHLTDVDGLRSMLNLLSWNFSVLSNKNINEDSCVLASLLLSSCSVGAGSVVEYSRLEEGVSVGKGTLVSRCWVSPGLSVPDGVSIHTLCVTQQNRSGFVTVAFGVDDNLKSGVEAAASMEGLTLCGVTLDACTSSWGLGDQVLRFSGDTSRCSLWNACLFPVCSDAKSSFSVSLKMLQAVLGGSALELQDRKLISLQEALQCQNLQEMQNFTDRLGYEIAQRRLPAKE
ncbi:fucose-1-phosphate guanylyltransferase [Nerophis ophidion]|uniref:fucose-1-phosphate guanylyltransferase n=1 Tax=Nerophis ophidion TaxID=159077 RepID=UPI002ADFB141|nr:fucose-1-phosphate guanylyltransferase [Nerophis ophidion]XP_061744273.1 fucose-1-phosphate guanylyltransferase [Nerophis ophidion]